MSNFKPRRIRIVSKGWETFTSSLGHGAMFENGVSVDPVDQRNIRRIGASLSIVDAETGEPLGPSAEMAAAQNKRAPVFKARGKTPKQNRADNAEQTAERARLIAEAKAREEKREADRKAAEAKRLEDEFGAVVYSREELEAVAANDGIKGLREIADPLGVKNTSISGLIEEILNAQVKVGSE